MKILLLTDLHLFDTRMTPERDRERLGKLGCFINECGAEAVLNLGDTISRSALLRPECPSGREGFRAYLRWRAQFRIPFAECALVRELDFFSSLMGQEPEAVLECGDAAVITATPRESGEHSFTPAQLDFLFAALDRCRKKGLSVVIGTHVPYPGSCSRKEAPGIFLEIPPELHETLTAFPRPVWWCGGHFHWAPEPPKVTGSLTALYAGRFRLDTRKDTTYLRLIDTATGRIDTFFPDF